MPVLTSYSEPIFRAYLVSVLHEVATIIGWDTGSPQVEEAKNDALLDFGSTDISTVTSTRDMRALRALGRRAIWRAVAQAVSAKYDFSDADARFTRSQIQAMALESLKLAEADCLEFNPNYAVSVSRVSRPHDPYAVLEDATRIP